MTVLKHSVKERQKKKRGIESFKCDSNLNVWTNWSLENIMREYIWSTNWVIAAECHMTTSA